MGPPGHLDASPFGDQAGVVALVLSQFTQLVGEVQRRLKILEFENPVQLWDVVLRSQLPFGNLRLQLGNFFVGNTGLVPAAGLAFFVIQSGHFDTSGQIN